MQRRFSRNLNNFSVGTEIFTEAQQANTRFQ